MEKTAKEKILDILEDICQDEVVKEEMDINLIEERLINSIDYIELLAAIEDEFDVVIAPSELTMEDMATPGKMVETITARL